MANIKVSERARQYYINHKYKIYNYGRKIIYEGGISQYGEEDNYKIVNNYEAVTGCRVLSVVTFKGFVPTTRNLNPSKSREKLDLDEA